MARGSSVLCAVRCEDELFYLFAAVRYSNVDCEERRGGLLQISTRDRLKKGERLVGVEDGL